PRGALARPWAPDPAVPAGLACRRRARPVVGLYGVEDASGFPLGTGSASEAIEAVAADGEASAAVASRVRNAPSSPMVLISGAGKTTVVFLSTPISTRLCRLRRVVWAIWLMAAPTFSMATTDLTASTTRK